MKMYNHLKRLMYCAEGIGNVELVKMYEKAEYMPACTEITGKTSGGNRFTLKLEIEERQEATDNAI